MAQKINYFLTRGCDLLLAPFAKLPPFWGILFLSLLTSLFVLVVYRTVSSPQKVRDTKNQIKANILAIRLYRDFWKTIVGSFFKSLYYTGKYFILNLVPLFLALPLLFLLFVQMDIRYGMRPFRPDESITVKAGFKSDIGAANVEIQPNPHFRSTMNPVFITALREVDWKLKAGKSGSTTIAINVDGATVSKNLVIGKNMPALSNKKMAASALEHFIYPAEKLLAAPTSLKYVYIQYPARSISFLGIRTHWLVYYLVFTMVIALALKNKFGVEF
ncbi:MAG: hypothetical protein L6428_16490 [Candidatus Aminicenantes bacterium]|nr:hypothetical protein [Acidobacteriota bacterium]MCG2813029.1 hypothetical protein [Candidatus Aminicenantes bacterium]